ncbi:hypothetical protein B0H13DRAFT_1630807 [Mycena leptocephala]|nr:hypothetical protein B0H13DRAFT_1630807 [Mycena leptocephala]
MRDAGQGSELYYWLLPPLQSCFDVLEGVQLSKIGYRVPKKTVGPGTVLFVHVKIGCGRPEQAWRRRNSRRLLLRHKDIGRKIRNILWKGLHQTYICNNYWSYIPMFEQCPVCNVDEGMEHILLECSVPGQELQLIEVPKAWIRNLLFWDVFKEFSVSE